MLRFGHERAPSSQHQFNPRYKSHLIIYYYRYTKGAESQVMCFEYQSGTEDRSFSNPTETGNIQKRPRVCSHDETKNDDNNCICYIIQAAGQSGPKQTPDGAGFRPEIDYLEVRT